MIRIPLWLQTRQSGKKPEMSYNINPPTSLVINHSTPYNPYPIHRK
jgi:hypothetical protein